MAERGKILVIDDDPDIHDAYQLVLESAGHQVLLAASGAAGKTLVATEHPDLVVLDIMMEEADMGFQMATWLNQAYPTIPVLMLSSIADAAEGLFDTGSLKLAELVNKPLGPQELLNKVELLLSRKRSQLG